jgi:hypothetical protein
MDDFPPLITSPDGFWGTLVEAPSAGGRYTVEGIQLSQGAHHMEFVFHITSHTQSRCVLKWKKPGDTEYTNIPTEAFAGDPCTGDCGAPPATDIADTPQRRLRFEPSQPAPNRPTPAGYRTVVYDATGRLVDMTGAAARGGVRVMRVMDPQGAVWTEPVVGVR